MGLNDIQKNAYGNGKRYQLTLSSGEISYFRSIAEISYIMRDIYPNESHWTVTNLTMLKQKENFLEDDLIMVFASPPE